MVTAFASSGIRTRVWLTVASCALAISGCGASAASICDEICDCEGCSDTEHDECVDDIEDAEREAENEGCEDEYDDLVDCLDSELECRDNDVDADGCEPEAEDLADCMGSSSSGGFGGSNVCERAAAICGGPGGGECTPQAECISECIVDAGSCDVGANQALAQCVGSCA